MDIVKQGDQVWLAIKSPAVSPDYNNREEKEDYKTLKKASNYLSVGTDMEIMSTISDFEIDSERQATIDKFKQTD